MQNPEMHGKIGDGEMQSPQFTKPTKSDFNPAHALPKIPNRELQNPVISTLGYRKYNDIHIKGEKSEKIPEGDKKRIGQKLQEGRK